MSFISHIRFKVDELDDMLRTPIAVTPGAPTLSRVKARRARRPRS